MNNSEWVGRCFGAYSILLGIFYNKSEFNAIKDKR